MIGRPHLTPAELLALLAAQGPAPLPAPPPPPPHEVFTEVQQQRIYEDAWRVTFESIG